MEDPPSNTPTQFGVGIALCPSSSEDILPPSEVPEESLRNLLDRLNMFEQPSTSRTVSPNTVAEKIPAATPTIFVGVPSVPTSSQSLDGVHPGAALIVWTVLVCSSGFVSGISTLSLDKLILHNVNLGKPVPKGKSFL